MPRTALTGSRIRERRAQLGLKQGDVARDVGISPAYLNLIEHNRRRVPEALLQRLAEVLDTGMTALAEGAEPSLAQALREAAAEAARPATAQPETEQADEFVTRYPGWAGLLAERQARITELDRQIEVLTERLAHDPQLSGSLHEVLSAVTSIRSTAGILAETGDIEPEWQARFHLNLREDSERLAGAAQGLVAHLDAPPMAGEPGAVLLASPQEELEAWLATAERPHALAEAATPADRDPSVIEQTIATAPELASPAARTLAMRWLAQARQDAERLPLARLRPALTRWGIDPLTLAHALGADPALMLRRLGNLPGTVTGAPLGLVAVDAAGAITRRRSLEGFSVPRFGAGCALWPVYAALQQAGRPIRQPVVMAGRMNRRFQIWAAARSDWPAGYEAEPVTEAVMLILPQTGETGPEGPAEMNVGPTCRICIRTNCPARREPSILAEG